LDLAYIYQRYKEIHDFLHVLLSRGPSVYEEIEVKWFEFQQLELASAALASIVGPLRLTWSGKVDILTKAGPEMIMRANNARFCMNIYYEKYFEKDIKEVQEWFLDKNKLIS
jgi:ubiquinone biosynthesis protein COQ4